MSVSRRVGYAVVGLGRIAERAILPAFRHSKKARLVALVSGDDHKAKRLARQFGAEDFFSYDDFALCLNHPRVEADRKSTRLNSSHTVISYAVFCLKKKRNNQFALDPNRIPQK